MILPGTDPQLREWILSDMSAAPPDVALSAMTDMMSQFITGEAAKLFEEIPGARQFELVPFCGHFWQEERPAEFASIMGQFLTEHLGKARSRRMSPLPVIQAAAADAG